MLPSLTRRTSLALAIAGATLVAQDRPLPDRESFLQETHTYLQRDSTLQSSYVYVETRRELKLDKRRRTNEESVKVFESYPGLPGESRWERLIAENGRDYELVKLEAEAVDTLSFGLGVLARLHKGARLSFLRRKDQWGGVAARGRPATVAAPAVGLLFTLRRGGTSEYSGYRKYSVDTSSTVATPK